MTAPSQHYSPGADADRYRQDSERAYAAGHYALAQTLDRAYQQARDADGQVDVGVAEGPTAERQDQE